MDQSPLVSEQIDEGRRFIERFVAEGAPVRAAFWGKAVDEDTWFLYVATELRDREGPSAAYRAVRASLQRLETCALSGSEVKAISPNNPIAKDVISIMARYPARLATWIDGSALGSAALERVYVYSLPDLSLARGESMTTEEVGRELLRLMNRDPKGVSSASITLKDKRTFQGIPLSLDAESAGIVARFIANGEATPRNVRIEEIALVR